MYTIIKHAKLQTVDNIMFITEVKITLHYRYHYLPWIWLLSMCEMLILCSIIVAGLNAFYGTTIKTNYDYTRA